jgi:chitinase
VDRFVDDNTGANGSPADERQARDGVVRSAVRLRSSFLIALSAVAAGCGPSRVTSGTRPDAAVKPGLWVLGYLRASETSLPLTAIPYGELTHIAHFSLRPRADGSLNAAPGLAAQANPLVEAAHGAGVQVLVTLGGDDSATSGFRAAIGAGTRPSLVANVLAFVATHGYDGVDLDMEPVLASDEADYATFVVALRAGLDSLRPGLLLTAAASREAGSFYASIAASFDQVNVVTYNMASGLAGQPGSVTWHDSPLYTDGHALTDGRPLPSCDLFVQEFLAAGVAPAKVGMGIYFHGKIWQSVTGPYQSAANVMSVTDVTFADLMDTIYDPLLYHWDAGPEAPYLSDATHQRFISYNDERLVTEKVQYAKANGLGGVIIWDLAADYRPAQPSGQEQPLLGAIWGAR